MNACLNGQHSALQPFYLSLLTTTLIVPERYQTVPAKEEPKYPSSFSNLLGVIDGERVVVPAITEQRLVTEWANRELAVKSYRCVDLMGLVPAGWWCCINPGQECSKELSPWEISELKLGEKAVPAVVEEYLSGEQLEPLTLGAIADSDHRELKEALKRAVADLPTVTALHLIREQGVNEDNVTTSRLLLGASLLRGSDESLELVRGRLESVAAIHTIGDDELFVFVGEPQKDKLLIGIFKDFDPFFSRAGK